MEIDYRRLADVIANEIAAGKLRSGDRLPTQRQFAFERGVANSTAGRVYGELLRRNLVVGEVGRGTFVAARSRTERAALAEPGGLRVDLELNFPVLPEQEKLIAPSLAPLMRPDVLADSLRAMTTAGTEPGRAIVAAFTARKGWRPEAKRILFCGSGRQAIAAAVMATVPRGGRLGVEMATYPIVKQIAAKAGFTLVPLAVDEEGVVMKSLHTQHRIAPLSALYLQPTLHNPLGISMSKDRRRAVAEFIAATDMPLIDDAIYAFLSNDPPLSAEVPENGIVVDSLSKRIAPGLSLGYIFTPERWHDRIAEQIRSGGFLASRFAYEAALRIVADGTAETITQLKRKDAAMRQNLAERCLRGFTIRADRRAYHLWLELPKPWRSELLVAEAARLGIAIPTSQHFMIAEGHAPNAVRLALGSPGIADLEQALIKIGNLLRGDPGSLAVE
jgi:DNA-binding transcriptional MocR family regulator